MPVQNKAISIGLVGLGWVGVNRHIAAIRRCPGLVLKGIADRNPQRVTELARRLGVKPSVSQGIDKLAWLDEVDAIDVATSPGMHEPLIRRALERGKHVITEKPFCLRPEEGERLTELAAAKGLQLAIVHNFQFASSCQRLAADLAGGRLGTIRSISAVQWGNPGRRLPTWYEELPLGLFYDESPHLLYLLRAFAPGPLTRRHVDVYPSTTGHRTPAAVEALYHAQAAHGQVPVSLSCKFESAVSEWYLSVHGDRGVGIVDVFRDIYIHLPNDGRHGTFEVLRTSWKALSQHAWAHLINGPLHLSGRLLYGNDTVFARFAQAVVTGCPPQGMSAQDALAVLRMQHDIVDAARQDTSP
jgi:scyllo-inositol 2-dehydrogenase (NADP+)